MSDYKALQNGSDIRGVALEGVPGEKVNLTPDAVGDLAAGFALWLAERSGKKPTELRIAAGCDSRLSSPALLAAASLGVCSAGAQCAVCGLASTPAMFMATVMEGAGYDGSIMLTASHLPWNRNGMKFFTAEGGLESSDIAAVTALAGQPARQSAAPRLSEYDVMTPYSEHLRRVITEGAGGGEKPLEGFRVAVDAGNGAGGFFARDVLAPLGADVVGLYLEPDGSFPNHIPNPENKSVMDGFSAAVTGNKCDLGLIFDTDVDRAAAVDSSGVELARNRLIGLAAAIAARGCPGAVIVTDSVTSDQLADFITDRLGCVHRRYKRGYRNVINEAKRICAEGRDAPLAIETSGHAALRENYFLDDGAYLCCRIVIELARLRREGKELSALTEGLTEPLEAREYRIKITDPDFRGRGEAVLRQLAEYSVEKRGWVLAPDNCEGLRFSLPDWSGWFLLRMSLHDPIMPLNIESDTAGGAEAILSELRPFLDAREGLERLA